jgi:ABC-type multidrug transport system fused ATPase/permease subunit
VLSAVDAHVGRHIVESCICGVLDGKTRLLATHQLTMLSYADKVIYLDAAGRVSMGSVEELTASSDGFRNLLNYGLNHESEEDEPEKVKEMEGAEEEIKSANDKPKLDGKLMQAEEKARDEIPLSVYMAFFQNGNTFLRHLSLPALLMAIALSVFLQQFTNVWLSFWTADKWPYRSDQFYIGLFVMFGILSALFSFLFFYLITVYVNKTALNKHVQAVNRILHAPMSFFDTQPLGRIMNRFTKDSDSFDSELSDQTRLLLYSMGTIVGTFVLSIIYLPWFALALAGLSVVFLATAKFYRASARDIKRYESIGRSVVFAHFSESLSGLTTIKSYGDEDRFIKKSESAIDKMNAAYYLTVANQRWLALRLDMVAIALSLVCNFLCVTGQFHISASSVGLVVSSLIQVTGMLSMCIRQLASVENNMNSVERIIYYAEELPQEAPYRIEATKPKEDWPQQAEIEFKNATLRYQPHLPPVLKNLTLSINGSEKIGICGRTGAGKSTIMIALYRLSELSEGAIEVDGVDISTIGLQDLRKRLSIIPQDPVLFKGTVRSNIDPFGTATDVELWDALRRAWLIESQDVERVHNGQLSTEQVKFHLDQNVDDDGTNFSLGERQLLALARALVRKSNILILDEATSSVDFETDHKIQSTIKNEFSHCTILCIAHRLNTILGYDRILVLDAGEVAEFDDPVSLFQKSDGAFRSMCDHSGITLEQILEEQAARKQTKA